MAAAVVVGRGPRLYLVPADTAATEGWAIAADPARAARAVIDPRPDDVPEGLATRVRSLAAATECVAEDAGWARVLSERSSRRVGVATVAESRTARGAVPALDRTTERTFVREVARQRLEQALRSPEEVLTTLVREEERVGRSLGREERATESLLVVPGSPLAELESTWGVARQSLAAHRAHLLRLIDGGARALVPNLAAVVGPRVAARLLAAAGGRDALGRMRAPRLQLLGSRRRPSPDHGPRFGLIFLAERMSDVPPSRRGAFARSVGALAAIAARADAITHADLAVRLVARRDRRVAELSRRKK